MKEGMSVLGLFLEGLLSFFSPCVLPLVPLYVSYLTADTTLVNEEGETVYDRKKTFLVSLGFVLGIACVFFLLGLSSPLLHAVYQKYKILFLLFGGLVLIVFALVSAGVLKISFLQGIFRHSFKNSGTVGFGKAWLMGFFFSFAWSPCVGPLLAQALLMAGQKGGFMGWVYIGSYALGFTVLFLVLGLFTERMLSFIKKSRKALRYTGIIASVVVFLMGGYMIWQGVREIGKPTYQPVEVSEDADIYKFDFTLADEKGVEHKLSDFRGRKIIMSFFGTWCTYCNMELPKLKELQQRDDLQILLIAHPGYNGEDDVSYIDDYLKKAGYSFTVLYDKEYRVTGMYGVQGFPTTFVFNADGSVKGYVPGYVPDELWPEILKD